MLNNVQSHGIRLLAVSWAFVLVCSLSPCEASAQTDSVAWYGQRKGLVAPLNIPLVLAGNFGELRDDHFHTGLDFKTQGREGFPVIAASDGVISRVKVSPWGYGRALYLNSSEGWTTVYAHLQRFTPKVEQWAVDRQYEERVFAIDLAPWQAFEFQQGDTIGWSGNSGGSAGPHLHFEVRETATQRPVNPLFWGFDVRDALPPELSGLWVLPANGGRVNGSSRPQLIAPNSREIHIEGEVRFAVQALDRLDGASNRCGVYRAELRVDGELKHAWELDTLDFAVNRDMNALAYYGEWERTGTQVYRMHRLPGSRLPIHDAGRATAGIARADSLPVDVSVQVWDVHGNVRSERWSATWAPQESVVQSEALPYDAPHLVESDGATVSVPKNTFYEDFDFPLYPGEDEDQWMIGLRDNPLSKAIEVALPTVIPEAMRSTVLAMRLDRNQRVEETYTGKWASDGRFTFTTKTCGQFALGWDSVPPVMRPHKRHSTGEVDVLVVRNFGELRFSLADDLSGIKSWEGWLDGTWILFRWDPKRERIWYELADGKHQVGVDQSLVIRAEDEVGNVREWTGRVRFE